MNDVRLIRAVKAGDHQAVQQLLAEDGAAVDRQDEHGWTALSWAAGRGDVEAIDLLLAHGADPQHRGRDLRTPLMIARAASRHEATARLATEEDELGIREDPSRTQPYCRAYYLRDLEAYEEFPGESARTRLLTEEGAEPVAYLHQDFSVTASMWPGEDLLFESSDDSWREFCAKELGFELPEDLR